MMAEGPNRAAMGYILGKVEGKGTGWHGHVTAVTVAPEFRYRLLALSQLLRCNVREMVALGRCNTHSVLTQTEADISNDLRACY